MLTKTKGVDNGQIIDGKYGGCGQNRMKNFYIVKIDKTGESESNWNTIRKAHFQRIKKIHSTR